MASNLIQALRKAILALATATDRSNGGFSSGLGWLRVDGFAASRELSGSRPSSKVVSHMVWLALLVIASTSEDFKSAPYWGISLTRGRGFFGSSHNLEIHWAPDFQS